MLRKATSLVEGGIHGISSVLARIAGILIAIMALLTVSDVAGRYLLNNPVPGAYEVIEFTMASLIFLALAYALYQGTHVRVKLLISRFPEASQAIIGSVTSLIGAGMFALMAWQTWSKAWDMRSGGELTPTLSVPLYPFVFVAFLGSTMLCLELLVEFSHFLSKAVKRSV